MKRKPRTDWTLAALVGARMRDVRLERGLSLVQLHERGAPTASHMSLVERGVVDCTVETIRDVARILDVRPWQFLTDDDELAALDLGEAKRILFVLPNLPDEEGGV